MQNRKGFRLILAALVAAQVAISVASTERIPIVGVDIGSSFIRAAIHTNEGIEMITDSQSESKIPTVVGFTDSGPVVGEAAIELAAVHPELAVSMIPRLLGRDFDDPQLQEHA